MTAGPDITAWVRAAPAEQLSFLRELARTFGGRELLAFHAEDEPARYRFAGARIRHRRTGLRFCYVPLPGAGSILLAEEPLSPAHAAGLGCEAWGPGRRVFSDPAAPIYLGYDEIQALARGPLRLPHDDEWEAAYRAGTTTTYFWGEALPEAPPAISHPLGLAMPAWWDELTAEGWIRGGGAASWPWHGDDAAGPARLAAQSRRRWEDEPRPALMAVRFVLTP